MTLICAFCNRRIPKKDVAAGRYVHSRFTGARYCLDDKRHEQIAAKRRKARKLEAVAA